MHQTWYEYKKDSLLCFKYIYIIKLHQSNLVCTKSTPWHVEDEESAIFNH